VALAVMRFYRRIRKDSVRPSHAPTAGLPADQAPGRRRRIRSGSWLGPEAP